MKTRVVLAATVVFVFVLSAQLSFGEGQDSVYNYLPGDANMMAGLWPPRWQGNDVTYLVNYFRGINPPCNLDGFYAAADFNGSCSVTGGDVTRMVGTMRGYNEHGYCPNFMPAWTELEDIPVDPPAGWPDCDQ